jgi:asparagine synthase (glutamine-hydrolysing)
VPTFTLGFEDRAYDEAGRRPTLDRFPGPTLPNERVSCERTALGRYPRALWHCETPSASGLEVPQLVLAEAASRRVRVVLTGEGADELFGGYAWFRLDRALRRLGRLPLTLRRLALRVGPVAAWRPRATLLLDPPDMTPARYARLMGWLPPGAGARVWSRDLAARLGPDHEERAPSPGAADEDGWHPFARLQFLEMTMRLPNLITRILDGASMAHGVEARVPFLDHELVELAAWIPPRLKLRGRTEKYVLRRALQEDLPRAIRRRRKRGLGTPYREWLRAALPSYAEELLSPGRLRDKGYFDPARVATLLARHRAGHAGGGPVLLAVLAVQVWDELFVRGRGPFDG